MKAVVVALVLAWLACTGDKPDRAAEAADKCARVFTKLAPVFAAGGHEVDAPAQIKACRAAIINNPGREIWLDCVLGIAGEMSQDKLARCEALDRSAKHGSASAR